MKLLRNLIPAFLWQWDQQLLQSHPRIWATRVHLHLWLLLLCNALATVLGLLIHVSHRKFPNPEELFGYMMVPTIAYAAFWLYRVVRFNAEKRFGARRTYGEVGEFLVLWLSALLIMSIPTTLALTVGLRIAALTPDAEFADEVNHLGRQQGWFYRGASYYDPYADFDQDHDADIEEIQEAVRTVQAEVDALRSPRPERMPQGGSTHRFFRDLKEYRIRKEEAERAAYDFHDEYTSWIQLANMSLDQDDTARYNPDTAAFYFNKADSVERHCPLMLVEFDDFRPWSETIRFAPDSVLEREYLEGFERGDRMDAGQIERALAIASRYSGRARLIGADRVAQEFEGRRASTANLEACVQQLARISRAKDLRYFFIKEKGYFHLIIIFSFCLVLLLSAFKRIYWQPFLIAIVTGAVVPIIVLVLALILEHDWVPLNDDDIMVYTHWLIAAGLFASLFGIPRLKAYRTNRAVMVLLANAVVPFFAVFTLLILHEEFDVFGQDALSDSIQAIGNLNEEDPRLPALHAQAIELQAMIDRIMLGALWGGIALYVLALHPLFVRLYARLMALPERK